MENFLFWFGVALMAIGCLMLLFRKENPGANELTLMGMGFRLSHPALVIIILGFILVILQDKSADRRANDAQMPDPDTMETAPAIQAGTDQLSTAEAATEPAATLPQDGAVPAPEGIPPGEAQIGSGSDIREAPADNPAVPPVDVPPPAAPAAAATNTPARVSETNSAGTADADTAASAAVAASTAAAAAADAAAAAAAEEREERPPDAPFKQTP